jgi:hypothetical protein
MFVAEGGMFQGVDMSLMGSSCELKLYGVPISTIGAELVERTMFVHAWLCLPTCAHVLF